MLAWLLQPLVGVALPLPGPVPVVQGFAAGFVLLLGFAIPPIVALRRVPPLRVLRRDLGLPDTAGWAGYVLGVAALAGLILWEAQDAKTGWLVLGGALGTMLALAVVTLGLLRVFSWSGRRAGFAWRFGLANLRRRPLATVTQVVALGVGIMALVLLTLVRGDLLASWQRSLPPDAPNRFLVNIQPDQLEPLKAFFAQEGVAAPTFYPMVRGRLTQINGRPVSSLDYTDDRAKRLIDREFNLSWAQQPQADNRIVAGRWWSAGRARAAAVLGGGRHRADAGHRHERSAHLRDRRQPARRAGHVAAQGRLGLVSRQLLRGHAARRAGSLPGELRDQLPSAAPISPRAWIGWSSAFPISW